MDRQSFFLRNYLAHGILILFAFLVAGSVFTQQFSLYIQSEKQKQLQSTVISVASQTAVAASEPENKLVRELYNVYISQIADSDDVRILVTDLSGNAVFDAAPKEAKSLLSGKVDEISVKKLKQTGEFNSRGKLGNILPEESYISGAVCKDDNENPIALVYVSSPYSVVQHMMNNVSHMFVVILLCALAGALVISYFISARMTQPLKIMAMAAKEYAAGNFDIRVPEDNHCTEIDELAVSFNNMARDLAQLDELTRGFIGNVSHEFKTPMTTIGGFVDGMLDGTIPKDQQEKYLRIISEEVKRLSRMVIRMLDAAKIQSGELILNTAPFDFTEMTSQIALSFEQKIVQKNLHVDIDFEDNLMVNGDRDHIFRAVYNLVDNAVKFVDQDGKLTMKAYASGNFCEFSIKNTGTGISPEDIPHVFDRFYKTDRSRSLDRSGAGLGLYIVKNIINLHGGDISVRSDGGETEFSLSLPLMDKKAIANFMNSSQSEQ